MASNFQPLTQSLSHAFVLRALLGIVYAIGVFLGYALAHRTGIWGTFCLLGAPSITLLLITRQRMWPVILLAGLLLHTGYGLLFESLAQSLSWYGFSILTAMAGAWLLKHFAHINNEDLLQTLSMVTEQSPVSVIITDPTGKIEYVNPAFTRVTGYTFKECRGKNPRFLKSGQTDDVYPAIWRALTTKQIWSGQICNKQRNGDIIWEYARFFPILDARGEIVHLAATKEDITQQVKTEKALTEANQLNQRIIASAEEGVIVCDLSLTYRIWNPYMERLTGMLATDILGRLPNDCSPFIGAGFPEALNQALSGRVSVVEVRFATETGAGGWASVSNGPLYSADRSIGGVISIVRDITRQKDLEEQLRQNQKLDAVGLLAGGVAHDFNNILGTMMLRLDWLQRQPTMTPAMQAALLELQRETGRASALTKQLLLFGRRQKPLMRLINIHDQVTELTKMLRRLLGEQVSLEVSSSNTELWSEADQNMLDQVLVNLCLNARDAMPNGGTLTIKPVLTQIDETVSRNPEARTGKFICLMVTDTGCGMAQEVKARIFEPFFTTKDVGKGTGLGLAITHGIVKQHNGWIEVLSTQGVGTTFKVYLPAMTAPKLVVVQPEPEATAGGTETLLVVEDEEALRHAMVTCMRDLGYTVLEAGTAKTGLELWQQNRATIALVFTDMVLPGGMTGLELTKAVRRDSPRTPVVMASGYTLEQLEEVATYFLPKPFRLTAMAKVVRECLDGKHAKRV